MKAAICVAAIALAALTGTSTLAQPVPHEPAPSLDTSNNSRSMSQIDPAAQSRPVRGQVAYEVWQYRRALTEVKKQLKAATSDEERADLLEQKRQLEHQIISLQQS